MKEKALVSTTSLDPTPDSTVSWCKLRQDRDATDVMKRNQDIGVGEQDQLSASPSQADSAW